MISLRSYVTTLLAAGALAGCPANVGPADTGPGDVADTGVGTDVVDASTCTDATVMRQPGDAGACYAAQVCSGPFCPALFPNPDTSPTFVITALEITAPPALAAISSLLNANITSGLFFWGAKFDLTANTVKTGALQNGVLPVDQAGYLLSSFQFYNNNAFMPGDTARWDPQTAPIAMTAGKYDTSMALAHLTIPVFDTMLGDGGMRALLTELPLHNVNVSGVVMSADKGCIGTTRRGSFNSCSQNQWLTRDGANAPFGVITGILTTDDARAIHVVQLGNKSLCEIISGITVVDGGMMCDDASLMALPAGKKPDNMSPFGWTLRANFAAVSANVQ